MLVGVFSDAHGHDEAFDRARDLLLSEGCERLFFLGDSVGYIPSAGVVQRLRDQQDITSLKGNHDAMLLAGSVPAAKEAAYLFDVTAAKLTRADVAFLTTLESRCEAVLDGRRCLFVHGSPIDPLDGYVYPDTELAGLAVGDWDVVFMGHTHRPFVRHCEGRQFVNVGSCGLPRDDVAEGAACVYDTSTGEARILRFPIGDSAARVKRLYDLHPAVVAYLDRYDEKDQRERHGQ